MAFKIISKDDSPKNKRAMLRTLEAILAFMLTFTFLVYISHQNVPAKKPLDSLGVLLIVESDDAFRQCVYSNDRDCLSSIAGAYIPNDYEYRIVVDDAFFPTEGQDAVIESLFVATPETKIYKTVKLYYWLSSTT